MLGYLDMLIEDEDYKLLLLLEQASDAIAKAREKELRQFGVSLTEGRTLFVVKGIGNSATPGEISRRPLRTPHGVSGLLNRMEKGGLVRKAKDLDRKNLVRVVITEKGQEAYEQWLKREAIHRIMSSLGEEERQQLGLCLQKLRSKALRELNRSRP